VRAARWADARATVLAMAAEEQPDPAVLTARKLGHTRLLADQRRVHERRQPVARQGNLPGAGR
jgi:hypothetical protein